MSETHHIHTALKTVLADSYALYLKTQNYHWNVEGPHFKTLHLLFEEQYSDLALAIDEIAELIRGLGEKAPGTWRAYQELTSILDGNEQADASKMVADLAKDQDILHRSLQKAIAAAQAIQDEIIIGAMVDRQRVHRKNKWILNSSI